MRDTYIQKEMKITDEQSRKLNGFHTEEGLCPKRLWCSQFDTFAYFYAISNFYFLLQNGGRKFK